MTRAVLLLMHQGNSFTHEAAEAARSAGLALIALSSRPLKAETFEANKPLLADWILVDAERLDGDHVRDSLGAFRARGYDIAACVATFEGYRLLMAIANATLGARDSSTAALRLSLNKYELRAFLYAKGLSAVEVHRATPACAPALDPAKAWFVKPVRGASSFACFKLDNLADLDSLPVLQAQMRNDRKMAAIFMDDFGFLVEEFVEGPEFSFEIIAVGTVHTLCIHEKAEVERQARTTLEAMSISPPISLDSATIQKGADFIAACFDAVGLTAGAFHVEAKYWMDRQRWEIIEINPRMGGSLINASVEAVTGCSVMDLWIRSLVASDDGLPAFRRELDDASQLAALRNGGARAGSLFISKYGTKGRTIGKVSFTPSERVPAVHKLHVADGTVLENSDRAICLLDALWTVDPDDMVREIVALRELVEKQFQVAYK